MARRPAGPAARDGGRRGRGPSAAGAIAPGSATSPTAPAKPRALPEAPGPDFVLLGEFGRAHGLNGEVRLKSYTAEPPDIAGYGALVGADGRAVTIEGVRAAPGAAPDMLIARVRGVGSRDAAEALNRLALYVARARLGEAGEADEVFAADLIGARAVDADGATLATVVAVPNYGGGDLLELRPTGGGPTALLPFTRAFVPDLALSEGRITVALPEDFFAPPGEKPADDPG